MILLTLNVQVPRKYLFEIIEWIEIKINHKYNETKCIFGLHSSGYYNFQKCISVISERLSEFKKKTVR